MFCFGKRRHCLQFSSFFIVETIFSAPQLTVWHQTLTAGVQSANDVNYYTIVYNTKAIDDNLIATVYIAKSIDSTLTTIVYKTKSINNTLIAIVYHSKVLFRFK